MNKSIIILNEAEGGEERAYLSIHKSIKTCYNFSMHGMLKKFSQFILVLVLSIGWIFSGWPQIFNFPPNIQEALAEITFERTPSEASIVSPVSISVAVNYPDDLVYDGLSESVGLTREQLLNMKWWGIAVYTETDNFVFECVSTASPLPTTIFHLGAENYKTGISLGETKENCEAFITAEYPLFAVVNAASFAVGQ